MPNVLFGEPALGAENIKNKSSTTTWLNHTITHANSTASFRFQGQNTKACRLVFTNPVTSVDIEDAASDPRYRSVAEDGSKQVRLFSRTWDKEFNVNVSWTGEDAKGQTGRIVCLWSDANEPGVIPAYDEVRRFAPVWAAATKASDGLVEGFKEFTV